MRSGGGRGRIRTSVARKERQIYSLLVLATHPPVRTGGITTEKNSPVTKNRQRHNCLWFTLLEPASGKLRDASPDTSKIQQSWRRDLNPRPSDYKSDALPAELRQRGSNRTRISNGRKNCKGYAEEHKHVRFHVAKKPTYPSPREQSHSTPQTGWLETNLYLGPRTAGAGTVPVRKCP